MDGNLMASAPDMDMPNAPIDLDALRGIISDHAGIEIDCVRLERCPTGKFNFTWFADADGRPLVLRVAPPDDPSIMLFYEYRMMRQEPPVHQTLQAKTSVPVPTIHAYDFSHERVDRDFLIMERMPGVPLSHHPRLTRKAFATCLEEVSDALRQAHAIHSETYGYAGPHAPMEPQADWTSAFVIMWNNIVTETRDCGGFNPEEADFLLRLLDRHLDTFDRDEPPSLLHMDVWHQNILVDEAGHLTCLLDWDRAVWGDPEIEFAVLDYCGISEPPFWQGYGRQREDSPAARTRQRFYLLYEMIKYIKIRLMRSHDPAQADAYRRQSLQLASQLA